MMLMKLIKKIVLKRILYITLKKIITKIKKLEILIHVIQVIRLVKSAN